MTDSDKRIFLLNAIELCVAIFRGPDTYGWGGIADSGLPDLLARAPENLTDLTASLRNLQDSILNLSDISDLETEYVRLFVSASGGVPAPLYESCHLDSKPRTMGDSALAMRSRLDEAGLELALDSNEPLDHLTIELEYLYHLLSTGWAGEDPNLIDAGAAFAGTVMLPWVRRFRQSLADADPQPAFLHGADITLAVLEGVTEG